jgi:hypothetical protein
MTWKQSDVSTQIAQLNKHMQARIMHWLSAFADNCQQTDRNYVVRKKLGESANTYKGHCSWVNWYVHFK